MSKKHDSSTIGTNNGIIESVTYPTNDGIFWNNGITGIPGNLSDDPASNNYGSLHLHGEGQNYIDTFNTNLFQLTTNLFTINLWVSPYTSGGTLLQTGVYSTNGWYVACGGGNSYSVLFGTETNGFDDRIATHPGAIPSTVWTMLSIVRPTPTNAIIYLNGLSVTNQPIVICAPSTTSLQIGKTPGSTNGYDGDIWGIQIWNEPLSAASIALLYLNSSNAVNYP